MVRSQFSQFYEKPFDINKNRPLHVLSVETTVTNGNKSMKSSRNAAAGGCPQTAVIQF